MIDPLTRFSNALIICCFLFLFLEGEERRKRKEEKLGGFLSTGKRVCTDNHLSISIEFACLNDGEKRKIYGIHYSQFIFSVVDCIIRKDLCLFRI
jgi:hypothetical protein